MKINQKDSKNQQEQHKKQSEATQWEKAHKKPSQDNPSTEDTIGDEEKTKKTKMPGHQT